MTELKCYIEWNERDRSALLRFQVPVSVLGWKASQDLILAEDSPIDPNWGQEGFDISTRLKFITIKGESAQEVVEKAHSYATKVGKQYQLLKSRIEEERKTNVYPQRGYFNYDGAE